MFSRRKKNQQQQQHPDELLNDLMSNIDNSNQSQFPNFNTQPMNQSMQQPNMNQQLNMNQQQQQYQQHQQMGFEQPQNYPSQQQNYNLPPSNFNAPQSGSSDMSGFNFPDYNPNNQDVDQRINNLDFISQTAPSSDNESTFQVEEPRNLQEAKQYIYKLIEKIHYLEATLVSLSSNYDNERLLAKKQGDTLGKNSRDLVELIQDVLQQEKYKYEKENGSLSEKSFSELIDFMRDNMKKILSLEKSKNAKLFTMMKDLEKRNERLEGQLSMSSASSQTQVQQDEPSGVYKNVSNVDKINSILGGSSNSVEKKKDENLPLSNAQPTPSKLQDIKEDISSFNAEINKITLHKNEEAILKVLGSTGVDNNDNLVSELQGIKSVRGNLNENSFKTMVYNYRKRLLEKKLIQTHSLDLPMKGYRNMELFELTDLGRDMYQQVYGQPAVESYLVKRKNQHTSFEHSFTIEKVAEHLELNKYEVITDEKDLRFPVKVDERNYHIEFDLIAKKDGEEFYIEVEMGTTKQSDFNDKCDKNYAFSKQTKSPIVIISPTKRQAEQSVKKVNNWMNARGGYKTMHKEGLLKVLLPYFDEIKSNSWRNKIEYFIDLTR